MLTMEALKKTKHTTEAYIIWLISDLITTYNIIYKMFQYEC